MSSVYKEYISRTLALERHISQIANFRKSTAYAYEDNDVTT